jgi:hypothetical protein
MLWVMDIRYEIPMDRKLFVGILRAGMRSLFRWFWLLGGAMVLVGGAVDLLDPTVDLIHVLLPVVGVATFVAPWLIIAGSVRRLRRLPQQPWRYRVTDATIEETTPMVSARHPWTSVRDAAERGPLVVLRMRPAGVIGLPRTAMTEAEASELTAMLVGRGFLKRT